ncbi:MAG: histidine--tRNA ligase [Anaerolineales bacterium]|nr:histidine--tRNA ligase [Anaerolineales bacterium]
MTIQTVKGTRDFFPEDMAFQTWLKGLIRDSSEKYGYQEYDGPFLETVDLYAAKSGEELVKEQSFVFPDRSGDLLTLRPELTPSLARMVASLGRSLVRPVRWWSFGPFWRYEKPQKGRTREFFQWNLDMLGIDTPQADAEVAAVAVSFLQKAGLSPEQVKIYINNRRLVDQQLQGLDINAENRPSVFRLIDRRDKLSFSEWKNYALSEGLSEGQLSGVQEILQDRTSWEQCEELVLFFDAARDLGVSDYLEYDPSIIRGLDYYTGTVFEARDLSGDYRAILGGGRYDNLVADVGGEPISGVGFAMGDVVIGIFLKELGLVPDLLPNPAQLLVTTFNDELMGKSLALCQSLRSAGLRVEWYPLSSRMSKQLKYANRQGIPLVVIMGPDEAESGSVTLKDMRSGDQSICKLKELPSAAFKMLE